MMKLLLDESVPRRLTHSFPSTYEIRTVPEMGWAGTKNGELLIRAQEHGFQALITADQGIEHQQNRLNLPLPVIVLVAYRTHISYLIPLMPRVIELLESGLDIEIYQIIE